MTKKNEAASVEDTRRNERWVVIRNLQTGEAICLPKGATLDEVCDLALDRWGESE